MTKTSPTKKTPKSPANSEMNARAKTTRPAGQIERCPWPGINDPIYAEYHDTEWGVPQLDNRALFEKIVLEGFQSGLSWLTILKKRDAFREAFDGFDPEKIAGYNSNKLAKLITNKEIVRSQAKIASAVQNAKAYLRISETEPFSEFVWAVVDGKPIINHFKSFDQVPTETEQSRALAKKLKAAGFRFVGPTTMYAFMQSVGMVNDHLVDCPRHAECAKLQEAMIAQAKRVTSGATGSAAPATSHQTV